MPKNKQGFAVALAERGCESIERRVAPFPERTGCRSQLHNPSEQCGEETAEANDELNAVIAENGISLTEHGDFERDRRLP